MSNQQTLFLGTKQGLRIGRFDGETWEQDSHYLAEVSVTGIIANDEKILLGTTNGIYQSGIGDSWTPSEDRLTIKRIRSLARHPQDKNFVVAGTEPASVFLSHNFGRTWKECTQVADIRDECGWFLPYSPRAGCIRGFAFQNDHIYAAAEEGGLLYSKNKGADWQLVPGSSGEPDTSKIEKNGIHPDVHYVYAHPHDKSTILAATGGGLYRTADRGATWDNIYHCYCRALWIDPDRPEHIIFGPARGVDRDGRIMASFDAGKNWKELDSELSQPFPRTMVEYFASTMSMLFCVLSDGTVLYSQRDSILWKTFRGSDNVQTLAIEEPGHLGTFERD